MMHEVAQGKAQPSDRERFFMSAVAARARPAPGGPPHRCIHPAGEQPEVAARHTMLPRWRSPKSVVVIGGGIAGASITRSLAAKGVGVTLLEKAGQLCAGATWHAAGLVTRFGGSPKIKKIHVRALREMIELHEAHDVRACPRVLPRMRSRRARCACACGRGAPHAHRRAPRRWGCTSRAQFGSLRRATPTGSRRPSSTWRWRRCTTIQGCRRRSSVPRRWQRRRAGLSAGLSRLGHCPAAAAPSLQLRPAAPRPRLPGRLCTQVAALHPLVDVSTIEAGLYTPQDGDVCPTLLTTCVAKLAKADGASIVYNAEVDTVARNPDGSFAVTTSGGMAC